MTVQIHGTARGELLAAKRIAKKAGVVEHRLVRLQELMEAADIAEGPLSGGVVPPTYIPMKNAVFYSLAAAYAEETGSRVIIGGHNQDDKGIFKDTSDRFFASLESAFREGSPRLRGVKIDRPLRNKTKVQVVRLAAKIKVPLALTWSCHRDGERQCGRCEGCLTRARVFEEAGIADPLGRA